MSLYAMISLIKMAFKFDRYRLDKKLVEFEMAIDRGDLEDAEQILDKHLEHNSGDEVALCHKAIFCRNRGDTDSAIHFFKLAVKSNASYAESRYLLGQLYLELEEYELARTYLNSGLLMKERVDIILDLGKAYLGKGDKKEAINCFKKVVNRDEKCVEAYKILIDTAYSIGNEKLGRKYEHKLSKYGGIE